MKLHPLVLALPFALSAASARAAAPSEADRLIDRGVDLREEGKDAEALELFQRAFQLNNSPRAQAQIGLAEQALGRWVDAEGSLEKALAEARHPWIKSKKSALESALAKVREHVGRLEILGTAGAEVHVDGRSAGTLPLAVHVVAGTITLEVSAEGHLPVTRTVSVPAGGLARETVELVKKREATAAVAPPPGPKASEAQAPLETHTGARAEGGGGPLHMLGYVSGVAAIGSLGLATTFFFVRNSHISSYNDDEVCLAGGLTRDENCRPELDSAHSAETLMTIGLIGAGVLGGTAAALLLLDDGEAPRGGAGSLSVGLAPAPGGWGAFCSGRF